MTRLLVVVVVVFVLAQAAQAITYTCFVAQNTADPQTYGLGCTAYYVPKALLGWKLLPDRKQSVAMCKYCSFGTLLPELNFTSHGSGNILVKQATAAEEQEEPAAAAAENNPFPCCQYSDPTNNYLEPIDGECVNPEYKTSCDSTLYGLKLFGQWYVAALYNQCFFVTERTL